MSSAAVRVDANTLPLVLAGPILRAVTPDSITLWLATSEPVQLQLTLMPHGNTQREYDSEQMRQHCRSFRCAGKLFLQLIHIPVSDPLPVGCRIDYDLKLAAADDKNNWQDWQQWAPDLVYPGHRYPCFILQPKLQRLLHGSCRKPHYPSDDGLLAADLSPGSAEAIPVVNSRSGRGSGALMTSRAT